MSFGKLISKVKISLGSVLACLGVMVAVFVPIVVFVMQEGVELRIDRLVIVDRVLSLNWYVGLFSVILVVVFVKMLMSDRENMISGALNLILIVLLLLLVGCSCSIFHNSMLWLNDVPISTANDNAYTSNPSLSDFLAEERDGYVAVRVNNISSYKKRNRLAYINNVGAAVGRESLWEVLLNDKNIYEYEGKNDFWLYLREYYIFLAVTDSEGVVRRGFENLKIHVKDFGAYVDESNNCSYVPTTLLMLKYEKENWKAELWSELAAQYMATAISDVGVYSNTRTCWLGSLPDYLSREEYGVGDEEHLGLLTNALWVAFNSFEIQNSQYRAAFYSDVPSYIVDFYNKLASAEKYEDFYDYVRSLSEK